MTEQQKKTRTTLQDVADKVGVTKMTVSRYMRNPDSVAAKTRAKIAAVIEEMRYIENKAPAMLSKSSSKAIGILLPSLSNQIFAAFVQVSKRLPKRTATKRCLLTLAMMLWKKRKKLLRCFRIKLMG
jgi:LacI family transcriptional regulator, gluconate utilization system Gnt-I transcriptional repressor